MTRATGTSCIGIVFATGFQEAANAFNEKFSLALTSADVYNFGLLLVPVIVSLACIVGFIVSFRMPRDFSQSVIADELKKQHPEYDISMITDDEEEEDGSENVFVMDALWVLSGGIFGFIWAGVQMSKFRKLSGTNKNVLFYVLSCVVPFFSIYHLIRWNKQMNTYLTSVGKEAKNRLVVYIVSAVLLPLLPHNPIAQSVMQHDLNKALAMRKEK